MESSTPDINSDDDDEMDTVTKSKGDGKDSSNLLEETEKKRQVRFTITMDDNLRVG